MYRMVYRQEGGLSNLNPHDYMRQEVDKSLAKFKQRSSNVGQQARSRPAPRPAARAANIPVDTERLQGLSSIGESKQPSIIDRAKNLLPNINIDGNQLFNQDQIIDVAIKHGGVGEATGKPSDARHRAVVNEISKKIAGPSLPYPTRGMPLLPIQDIIGDIGSFGAGLMNEFPALFRGFSKENVQEIIEDIVSNWKGSFGTSNITTPEQIFEEVYGGPPVDRFKKKQEQVDEWGGLADLPEGDREIPYVLNPGDLPEEWGDKSFLSKQPTESEIRMNNWSEYGGFNPYEQAYYTDPTGSTLYPGYLGLDYGDPGFMPDFEKKYYESPYKTSLENYNSRLNQSIPTQPTGFEGTGYGQFSPQVTATTQQANAFEPTNINLLQNYYQGQQ